jgi:hypothetical protein
MKPKIPKSKEAEILFANRHSCCICHDKDKDVQIHHIDGNNKNDNLSNLAVLCIDHHSKVTGQRGLGKRYTELEIRKYKQEWESITKKEYGLFNPKKIKLISKIEKRLFVFKAKDIIYEMMTIDDSKENIIDKHFKTLWHLSLLEGIQKEIIDHLHYAFSFTSINQINKPIALANALPLFFNYLVNPNDIKMNRIDENNILKAIETIDFCHSMSIENNKNYRILNSFKNSLIEFNQIGIRYKNIRIFRKSLNIMKTIKNDSIKLFYKKDKKLIKIHKEIESFYQELKVLLKKENLKWKIIA